MPLWGGEPGFQYRSYWKEAFQIQTIEIAFYTFKSTTGLWFDFFFEASYLTHQPWHHRFFWCNLETTLAESFHGTRKVCPWLAMMPWRPPTHGQLQGKNQGQAGLSYLSKWHASLGTSESLLSHVSAWLWPCHVTNGRWHSRGMWYGAPLLLTKARIKKWRYLENVHI